MKNRMKYAGHILRYKQIPDSFDYNLVPSLRTEARVKLTKIRPQTLGQASRISGVSPADIAIIMVWLKRGSQKVTVVETDSASAH